MRATSDMACASVGFSSMEPSMMALLMRLSSWNTMRPAPMFRWPTSELPIWPAGRPTSSPDAPSVVCGYFSQSSSKKGFLAL